MEGVVRLFLRLLSRAYLDLPRGGAEVDDRVQAIGVKQSQLAVVADQGVAAAVAVDNRGVQQRHTGTVDEVGRSRSVVAGAGPVGGDLQPGSQTGLGVVSGAATDQEILLSAAARR